MYNDLNIDFYQTPAVYFYGKTIYEVYIVSIYYPLQMKL